ncbi:MAG: bifunctional nuclease family protein [Flavobacteriaceae bacterium]|nr:bifunctional nuclease family protein [Flavobacteriaceae bacterium]
MSLVRLHIKEISYSHSQKGAYVIIFKETLNNKMLPIVIGAFEAQSIVIALEKDLYSPRPLTHDLFKTFADKFEITIKQVIIYKLVDGIFYANLVCEQNGVEHYIDSRTSDAVALAIRSKAPIFIYKDILDEAGVYLSETYEEENDEIDEEMSFEEISDFLSQEIFKEQASFSENSLEELEQKMARAIENEDYELAAQIRDEIEKRKK